MCNLDLNFIFYSSKNLFVGSRLRDSFRKIGIELSYVSTVADLINWFSTKPNTVVFFSKEHGSYARFLSKVLKSDLSLTRYCRVVFVDDDLAHYAPYVNNTNFFCLPECNLEAVLYSMVTKCEISSHHVQEFDIGRLNQKISDYLTKLGFSFKLVGFKFLKQSIEQVVKNDFNIGSLTKDVYPVVASLNQTSEYNIERSIRTAIDNAFKRTHFNVEGFEGLSENNCSNRFFISFIVDKLMNEIETKVG